MSTYQHSPIFTLKLARAKGVRYQYPVVDNPTIGAAVARAVLQDKPAEHLCVILLDRRHNNLGAVIVASGGIHGLHVQVRDVITPCLIHRASAFVMSHNHPSGDTTPSNEDLAMTRSCVETGKLVGCPMVDHIIVSSGINRGEWYSFLDHGLMPR